jgi:hypothetical protein
MAEIFCKLNDYTSNNINNLATYIIEKDLKDFDLEVDLINKKVKKHHFIELDYNANYYYHSNDIECIIQYYNSHETKYMCYMKDLYSNCILNNYLKNNVYSDACLLGSLLGICIIVHDENYTIEDLLWIVNNKIIINSIKNKETKRYFESITSVIDNKRDCLELNQILNYNISFNNNIFYVDNELENIKILRGSTLIFEVNCDNKFILYDENWNEININEDKNKIILKTDYDTPRNIYYNKNDKYHYIEMKDGISELFEKFFVYILNDDKKKSR